MARESAKTAAALRQAWIDLKREKAQLRARDAAEALGVSEAALIASLCGASGGARALRLREAGADIVRDVPPLGPVMALTRNENCVHEKIGPYLDVSINPGNGLVLGELIDLRIFPAHWRHAFAVMEETKEGLRRSIQVFDASGTAVHKIFQKPQTNLDAFDKLIDAWTGDDQSPEFHALPPIYKRKDRRDSEIDLSGLRSHWAALQDTHDFFGMLRDFDVGRLQALRLAGPDFAQRVQLSSLAQSLELAQADSTPIMVFVGNPGCIQIHSGPVLNLKRMGPWFNVLDPDFNLHLREDKITSAWIVYKPTRDGTVTSLELYDNSDFCFAQLFGARKPGKPELQGWRNIAAALPRADGGVA
ncbi:MAG: hemin-degrading factor [Alphaproteobacteria bacterium]|nr:hemin-degrading factor [Alphaproteobacteria bacterium]